ncbi:hypothetical protein TBLA_0F03530 [Henningerozyma blattae CBS 6284]|uniref:Reverse transcriptase Ty1/copia-type domain-containing protein n=1 Tax=Henningerozyma blattae (strain ATCC 34711 / CBS 6284 / DSM 70876 / NBRC 10599 / NRRL Y-10934 / UCD 77-7) TaxID=1071380 RepID=I2H688_HENB6|nr:hypothetical protein TBLA_0F03530 [Tetrapisispora blattae CBS 6284]CCH61890.1 hypothetical protein TBLA_0F03530 [Tetrapisispora blattae CBS 6284]
MLSIHHTDEHQLDDTPTPKYHEILLRSAIPKLEDGSHQSKNAVKTPSNLVIDPIVNVNHDQTNKYTSDPIGQQPMTSSTQPQSATECHKDGITNVSLDEPTELTTTLLPLQSPLSPTPVNPEEINKLKTILTISQTKQLANFPSEELPLATLPSNPTSHDCVIPELGEHEQIKEPIHAEEHHTQHITLKVKQPIKHSRPSTESRKKKKKKVMKHKDNITIPNSKTSENNKTQRKKTGPIKHKRLTKEILKFPPPIELPDITNQLLDEALNEIIKEPKELITEEVNKPAKENNTITTQDKIKQNKNKIEKVPLITYSKRGRKQKPSKKMLEYLKEVKNKDREIVGYIAFALMSQPKYFTYYLKGEDKTGYINAIIEEHNSFIKMEVYTAITKDETNGIKPIPLKVVLTKKTDEKCLFLKFKARFVCKGFKQISGIDFDELEISSSVSRLETLRIFIALSVSMKLDIKQYDVSTAFPNSKIDKEILVGLPKDLLEILNLPKGQLWKLNKTVYGLKQSNKEWINLVRNFMTKQGFTVNNVDENIYLRKIGHNVIICLSYVDDFLIATDNPNLRKELFNQMNKEWDVKDMGSVKKYLGMTFITYPDGSVSLDQRIYLTELLERYHDKNHKIRATPMSEIPIPLNEDNSTPLDKDETSVYRSIVGAILWASLCTRADLSYAISKLGSKSSKPTIDDKKILMHTLSYIKGTINRKLYFQAKKNKDNELIGFSDASFGTGKSILSQYGYIFTWSGTPISWCSKKQRSTSISMYESELFGLSEVYKESLWMRSLFETFSLNTNTIVIYEDNKNVISTAIGTEDHSASKHIGFRKKFINEITMTGLSVPFYVKSEHNIADLLTKPLGDIAFNKLILRMFGDEVKNQK